MISIYCSVFTLAIRNSSFFDVDDYAWFERCFFYSHFLFILSPNNRIKLLHIWNNFHLIPYEACTQWIMVFFSIYPFWSDERSHWLFYFNKDYYHLVWDVLSMSTLFKRCLSQYINFNYLYFWLGSLQVIPFYLVHWIQLNLCSCKYRHVLNTHYSIHIVKNAFKIKSKFLNELNW